jgi:DNA-directed RNA polymerase subunit RPC12/RpoP
MKIKCFRCKGRVFVDRVESSVDHLEVYCVICGMRRMFHPPSRFGGSVQWLHEKEKTLLKTYNGL